jgi:hypothetical protein
VAESRHLSILIHPTDPTPTNGSFHVSNFLILTTRFPADLSNDQQKQPSAYDISLGYEEPIGWIGRLFSASALADKESKTDPMLSAVSPTDRAIMQCTCTAAYQTPQTR